MLQKGRDQNPEGVAVIDAGMCWQLSCAAQCLEFDFAGFILEFLGTTPNPFVAVSI